jgi:hypothetical protein
MSTPLYTQITLKHDTVEALQDSEVGKMLWALLWADAPVSVAAIEKLEIDQNGDPCSLDHGGSFAEFLPRSDKGNGE